MLHTEDRIAWDLANSPNSPLNQPDYEPTLFDTVQTQFDVEGYVIEERAIISFEGEEKAGEIGSSAEILFLFNSSQTEVEIVGYWEAREVINFGEYTASVVDCMTQKDLDSLFQVLDLKLR